MPAPVLLNLRVVNPLYLDFYLKIRPEGNLLYGFVISILKTMFRKICLTAYMRVCVCMG